MGMTAQYVLLAPTKIGFLTKDEDQFPRTLSRGQVLREKKLLLEPQWH